jgi:hypothetical protein
VAGWHLEHPVVDACAWCPHEGEQLSQALAPNDGIDLRVSEDALRFGGEEHPVRGGKVEQRLDAHAVAHEDQATGVDVPQAEGVHPVEPVDEGLAPLGPGVQHDLGVAVGPEDVAAVA